MKVKRYLAGLILALCFILFGGTSTAYAHGIPLMLDGNTKKGTSRKSVTYTLEPKCTGIASVKIYYASVLPVKATVTDDTGKFKKVVESTVVDGKSMITFDLGVEKSTYDITLDFQDGSRDINYSISAKFKEVNSTDNGGGKSFAKATKMTDLDQKKGVVAFGEKIDYYKITFNKQDNVDLKVVNYSTNTVTFKLYNAFKDLQIVEVLPMGSGEKVYPLDEAVGVYYVTMEGSNDENQLGAKYTITTGDYRPITSLKLSETSCTLKTGNVKKLKATKAPSDATEKYLYKSSNTNVATVTNDGTVKAIKPGKAVITVYSVNDKVYDRCKVTVKKATTPKKKTKKAPTPTVAVVPTKAPTPSTH